MASEKDTRGRELDTVAVYDLTQLQDDSSKALAHLISSNHTNFAVLRDPRLLFHNHLPDALCSPYLLGAQRDKLEDIYAAEAKDITNNKDCEIQDGVTYENWRHFPANKKYTVAYTAFFDAEVGNRGSDWKSVVMEYLFSGDKPLINGFSGGLGHPFIHLAYAYEFGSLDIATETLSMGCTEYASTQQLNLSNGEFVRSLVESKG